VIAVKKVKFSSKNPEVEKREMVEFLKEVDIIRYTEAVADQQAA
jgi:hypothetical protein